MKFHENETLAKISEFTIYRNILLYFSGFVTSAGQSTRNIWPGYHRV